MRSLRSFRKLLPAAPVCLESTRPGIALPTIPQKTFMKENSLLALAVSPLPLPPNWYALPLRLIVGFGFFEHGFAKLSRGADGFIGILDAIGLPFAHVLGWSTIITEVVGAAR
jgi:DoxX